MTVQKGRANQWMRFGLVHEHAAHEATVPTVSPATPAQSAPPVAGGVEAELVGLLASMALAVATGR